MAYRRGRYYYRSRRVGGRVVTEYLGAGEGAERSAVMEARKREERALGAQLRELCAAVLRAHGYPHCH